MIVNLPSIKPEAIGFRLKKIVAKNLLRYTVEGDPELDAQVDVVF